jgi:type VI secretion system ImpM family protein
VSEIGCFGKVPAHGDFVWQGLPARFVTPWDHWLQEQLLALKEDYPDDWLEVYLRGHMWRFLLRDDALGPETWAGLILPSVDVVGRYFPFTIAAALPRHAPLAASVRALAPWLAHAENVALEALTDTLAVEDVLEKLRENALPETGERVRAELPPAASLWCGQPDPQEYWTEHLVDSLIGHSFRVPCHWSHVDPQTDTGRYLLTEGFSSFDQLFTG